VARTNAGKRKEQGGIGTKGSGRRGGQRGGIGTNGSRRRGRRVAKEETGGNDKTSSGSGEIDSTAHTLMPHCHSHDLTLPKNLIQLFPLMTHNRIEYLSE
jgi:hypothetical protein